jgi:hypothetical protein
MYRLHALFHRVSEDDLHRGLAPTYSLEAVDLYTTRTRRRRVLCIVHVIHPISYLLQDGRLDLGYLPPKARGRIRFQRDGQGLALIEFDLAAVVAEAHHDVVGRHRSLPRHPTASCPNEHRYQRNDGVPSLCPRQLTLPYADLVDSIGAITV